MRDDCFKKFLYFLRNLSTPSICLFTITSLLLTAAASADEDPASNAVNVSAAVTGYCDDAAVFAGPAFIRDQQDPYNRTSCDISQASDWSRWPSRPIRSLRYIVTCARIRDQGGSLHRVPEPESLPGMFVEVRSIKKASQRAADWYRATPPATIQLY